VFLEPDKVTLFIGDNKGLTVPKVVSEGYYIAIQGLDSGGQFGYLTLLPVPEIDKVTLFIGDNKGDNKG